jgi:hypothetical protein
MVTGSPRVAGSNLGWFASNRHVSICSSGQNEPQHHRDDANHHEHLDQ